MGCIKSMKSVLASLSSLNTQHDAFIQTSTLAVHHMVKTNMVKKRQTVEATSVIQNLNEMLSMRMLHCGQIKRKNR